MWTNYSLDQTIQNVLKIPCSQSLTVCVRSLVALPLRVVPDMLGRCQYSIYAYVIRRFFNFLIFFFFFFGGGALSIFLIPIHTSVTQNVLLPAPIT